MTEPDPVALAVESALTPSLAEHAYATGAPCDGERCEQGGAAHCHRCAEVEAETK